MTISVDGAAIDASAQQLRHAQAAIEHELEQLADTAGLLRDRWSGDAQRAFDRAHAQWQNEITAMAEILEQAIGALQAANTAAGDAERAAAALWA